jgi:hypothetical protein
MFMNKGSPKTELEQGLLKDFYENLLPKNSLLPVPLKSLLNINLVVTP